RLHRAGRLARAVDGAHRGRERSLPRCGARASIVPRFGAGAVAPIVFGRILDLTNVPGPSPTTWGWAFVALGGGGLLAAYCASGLASDRLRVVRAKAPSV